MAFWNKRVMNSDEYEKLTKKITDLTSDFQKLEARTNGIVTDIANLRGRFNQKLSRIKKEELEDTDEETKDKEESINNPVILPHNGFFK